MIKEGQEKLAGVYKIWHEKRPEYVYIGSTDVDLNRRFGKHLSELRANKHFNIFVQNVFNKYGESGFNCELIEESILKGESLRELEQKHIDIYLDRVGRANLMNGSLVAKSPLDDPAVIAKKVAGVKKAYQRPEVMEKARENMRRVHADPVLRAKRLQNMAETCARKTKARIDAEERKKAKKLEDWKNSVWGKPVVCMDDGKVFENAKEAIKHYNLNGYYTEIINVCLGKNNKFCGRFWEFEDITLRPDRTTVDWRDKTEVRCIDNNMTFESIREASRWLVSEGLTKTSNSGKVMVSESCQFIGRKAAGLTFEYVGRDYTKIKPPSQGKLSADQLSAFRKASGDKLRERMKDPENIAFHTKVLLEANLKLRKPVMCIETGQTHDSVSEAARWVKENTKYSGSSSKISLACSGKRPSAYGYHWRYLTTEDSSDTSNNPKE